MHLLNFRLKNETEKIWWNASNINTPNYLYTFVDYIYFCVFKQKQKTFSTKHYFESLILGFLLLIWFKISVYTNLKLIFHHIERKRRKTFNNYIDSSAFFLSGGFFFLCLKKIIIYHAFLRLLLTFMQSKMCWLF